MGRCGRTAFDFIEVHHLQSVARARVMVRSIDGPKGGAQCQAPHSSHAVDPNVHLNSPGFISMVIELLLQNMTVLRHKRAV